MHASSNCFWCLINKKVYEIETAYFPDIFHFHRIFL